ncbi:hypothetical protein D1BOALGB6SA_3692 [Olavius sp. associated proteobacterium Delta 1]|nr:hypothetical protein D1BOALGB6SA_3692 [Olavius sp. associated proteobacterium Delta 1]
MVPGILFDGCPVFHDVSLAIWLKLSPIISRLPSDESISVPRALNPDPLLNATMTIERKQKPCQQYNHLTGFPFLSINEFRGSTVPGSGID